MNIFRKFFFCRSILNQAQHAATNYGVPSSPTSTMAPQSGRGASVVSYFVTKATFTQKRNTIYTDCGNIH